MDAVSPVDEWAQKVFEFSLMDKSRYEKFKAYIIFPSYFHCSCTDLKRYENVVKFILMLVVVDDHTECEWGDVNRHGIRAEEVLKPLLAISDRILNKDKFTSISDWKPYVVYYYAVIENICNDVNPVTKRRLLSKFNDYIQGNIDEIKRVEQGIGYKDFDDIYQVS